MPYVTIFFSNTNNSANIYTKIVKSFTYFTALLAPHLQASSIGSLTLCSHAVQNEGSSMIPTVL